MKQEVFRNINFNEELPLIDILEDSCFYPASGYDLSPIPLLAHRGINSFVFCDYSISQFELIEELKFKAFTNYELSFQRPVSESEFKFDKAKLKPHYSIQLNWGQYEQILHNSKPHSYWTIWETKPNNENSESHFISILFIGGEGLATLQALYCNNKITPKALAIIQLGFGFGGNWTDFYDLDGPLIETIYNIGYPEHILFGYYGTKSNANFTPIEIPNYKFLARIDKLEPSMNETRRFEMNPDLTNRSNLRMLYRSQFGKEIDDLNYKWGKWHNTGVDRFIDVYQKK